MTVESSRSFEFSAPRERVWAFIADPENRAKAISAVESFTSHDTEDDRTTWRVRLGLPAFDRTIAVETTDVVRDPPTYVKFVGRSRILSMTGEHELTTTDDGCRLDTRFTVDGRLPGVERVFERRLDEELSNIRRAAIEFLETDTNGELT